MASRYTDQQRTRVVDRKKLERHARTSASIGDTQTIAPKPKLLEGISVAQLIAGAAAAATSMVLASEIGIAGSVIGAAVSSVVTVIASQLYRNFLSAGARKVKSGLGDLPRPGRPGSSDAATTTQATYAQEQARVARVAPAKLQARAAAERNATQRKVIIFSVVIATVMVIACTAAILIGTAGEGIGAKTEPLIPRSTSSQHTDDSASSQTQANALASAPDGPAAGADNAEDAGDASGDAATGGAASNGGGATDTESGTGSGTSSNGGGTTGGSTDAGSTGGGTGSSAGSGSGSTGSGSGTDSPTGQGSGTGTDTSGAAGASNGQ